MSPTEPVLFVSHLPKTVTDPDFVSVPFPSDTRVVNLAGCEIGEESLVHIARSCVAVEVLDLSDTLVTDSDLRHLRELTSLRQLLLTGTKVGDGSVEHLVELKKLEVLHLVDTDVGDESIERLLRMPTLKKLYVFQTRAELEGSSRFKELLDDSRLARGNPYGVISP
ncbi:MAG: hypothetical protein DWQ31_00435 [Planctomycetota bacterium]|nr:MAG: hypothetical protein DWQ31_00435 [Planctomycetota bacterium]REJ86657.1 MAG: hypothetical protein DWQ35_22775 [Planctomycetota bacterium]REK27170.1 MAG: hypothetical protein DWQ42_07640 [Planctomycetota bacterium]REK37833.1 MAG: hypothetical protein DWQ46_21465 [Planctomycetota bacterium]